jgi:hypothetical protein
MANTTIPDFPGFVWYALVLVTSGFIFLFWRVIKTSLENADLLREEIKGLREDLVNHRESIRLFPLTYRTREEAARDWKELQKILSDIQADIRNLTANQQEGIRQLWDKLGRTVESFLFLAKVIIDRQQAIESKLYCDNKDQLDRVKREAADLLTQMESFRVEKHQPLGTL